MADAEGALEAEAVDHCQHVVGEPRPLEVEARWSGGVAVPPGVEGEAVEVGQPSGDRLPDPSVEAGGVGQEQRRAGAAHVPGRDADAVG